MDYNASELMEKIKNLLESQNLGILATYYGKYPYTALVGYCTISGIDKILFATMKDTRKFKGIENNPNVSFLITNQKNCADDFNDAESLTVLGEASIATTEYNKKLYLDKFPFLNEFIANPNTEIIEISVDKYIWVTRFQEVMELTVHSR